MKPELRAKREAEMRLRNSNEVAQRIAKKLAREDESKKRAALREHWNRVYQDKQLVDRY